MDVNMPEINQPLLDAEEGGDHIEVPILVRISLFS